MTIAGLGDLLASCDLTGFFDDVWEQGSLLVRAGAVAHASTLLTADQFEFYLRSPHTSMPSDLSIVDGSVARPVVSSDGSAAQVQAIHAAYEAGQTLLQSRLQFRNEALAELCIAVESDLRDAGLGLTEPVCANAYLTPPYGRSLGLHYDDHSALVVQLSGQKRWTVFAPRHELPVDSCSAPLTPDDVGVTVLDTTLEPGDVLYLPRGFPHVAVAGPAHSLHVTLALRTMTWADAVGAVCREDVRFRRSLRRSAAGCAEAGEYFASELAPAVAGLPIAAFLRRRALDDDGRAATRWGGRLGAMDAGRDIGSDTVLERAPDADPVIVHDGDDVVLRHGRGAVRLDRAMAPVFEFIATSSCFASSDLPSIDAPFDHVELARVLVQQGLLRPMADAASPPRSPAHASAVPTTHRGLRDFTVLYRGSSPSMPRIDWVECKERLSPGDCDEIVATCSEFREVPPSTVGEDHYPAHRRAVTRKVGLTPRTQWTFDLLCEAANSATRACFGLELTGITRAPQYCEYLAGFGQFDRHNDYSHDQADSPRKLTVIVQLSDPADYAGGRLRVFGVEEEDLPNERGTIVLLPSFVYHQVTPVERGVRRALVAWIAGPRLR